MKRRSRQQRRAELAGRPHLVSDSQRAREALIREAWTLCEERDPEVSTEMLFALTEEHMRAIHGIEVDAGDISAALVGVS